LILLSLITANKLGHEHFPSEPEGILVVDKPQGITSHDVVDKIRRLYQTRRVGHAGTLDPMATGLLIILVGKATKASQYLMSQEKSI
jgi:tRNA pseudouridine55 synthase